LRDLKVTHQKNQPHPSLEKNELPPKKIKIKIKKCPGTRAQGCGALVPWYQGSHLRMLLLVLRWLLVVLSHL
jgi:hypothetical protein